MIRLVLAIALACAGSTALAQKKMYRCGNQYQERPCEGPHSGANAAAPAKAERQENATAHAQREQVIHQAKCQNYSEELADIERRLKAGADAAVLDQLKRRQKEMRARIERDCQ